MLTPEQIDALRDRAEQIVDAVVEFLIADIAERISEAGQLTSTAAYEIWRAQTLGRDRRQIEKELQKRLKVSRSELRELLTQAAEVGYRFDLDRFSQALVIPFAKNGALQQIVSAAVELADEDFANITQTIGFICPDGKARPLTKAYQSACDYAFEKVFTGAQDYASAVREASAGLASKGILSIDYESGVHTSLEAAVRRNIMGGLGLMQEWISQYNHDALGCNGWEISAHAASAPDHEPIQGKQYSDAEYTSLNNSLMRRIGTLNCGHSASPIILGVNEPQYTDEELERFRQENERGVEYEGKHYTLYEATQRQRKIERSMRKQKRNILIDEKLGDEDKLQTDQIRLVRLRDEYKRFSEAVDLPMQQERIEVAGFTGKHGNAAEKTAEAAQTARLKLENERKLEYNQKREEALRRIRSSEVPKELNRGNQQKHIKGSPGYIAGRSYIYGGLDTAQELVNAHFGRGEPQFNRKGEWNNKELVSADHIIGINVEMDTGTESKTSRFVIHYGKKGAHIVPTKELIK